MTIIESVRIIASDGFKIRREVWEQVDKSAVPMHCAATEDGYLLVKELWWSGECDELREFLAEFEGSADLALAWHGCGRHTGLRLRNGVVTEHEVVFALGKQV